MGLFEGKVAVVTDDTAGHHIDERLVDPIEANLRSGLSVYPNGGNTLWEFDATGRKALDPRPVHSSSGRSPLPLGKVNGDSSWASGRLKTVEATRRSCA